MEIFSKTKAVKLKSHIDKYLIADDDQQHTRQSKKGSSRKARWIVEFVQGNEELIRLKSCHGNYLTASNESFLLGMTGKKVFQTSIQNMDDLRVVWKPIKDGFLVKLRAFGGTYLRANGGTPPWRNSITHDDSYTGSTHNWILWDVEAVEIAQDEVVKNYWSMVSSFSSVSGELSGLDIDSPRAAEHSVHSPTVFLKKNSAMDLFRNAKQVRLRNVHNKYLTADEDEESVTQDRDGFVKNAKWIVEFVENADNIIHLKSCYNKYLTASNKHFLLGMTGKKVFQTLPEKLDSSIQWEPIREGGQVKLRTRYGQFLRANGGLPPWRNSVTHDIPHRTATQDWILWNVDVVDIVIHSSGSPNPQASVDHSDSFASELSSTSPYSSTSPSFSRHESNDSTGDYDDSPPKGEEGRVVYFHIVDENGKYDEEEEEIGIQFKGNDVSELTKRLEEVCGIENVVVCTKSPLNQNLYPLRLQLPPYNSTMHVFLVPSSFLGTNDL